MFAITLGEALVLLFGIYIGINIGIKIHQKNSITKKDN
jgi:hypothetical protein